MDDLELASSPRKKLRMDVEPFQSAPMPVQISEPEDHVVPPTAQEPVSQDSEMLTAKSYNHLHDTQLRKEEEVGIAEFVSPNLSGFTGTLKKRYTDFLVNEILPSGQVVHLSNVKAPKRENKKESSRTETKSSDNIEEITNDTHGSAKPSASSESAVQSSSVQGNAEASITLKEHVEQENPVKVLGQQDVKPTTPSAGAEVVQDTKDVTETNSATEVLEDSTEQNGVLADTSVSQWQAYASKPAEFQLAPDDDTLINTFFDADTVKEILALFNRVVNSPHRKSKEYGTVVSAPITDRDARTKIHQALRRVFSSRLESYTDDKGAMTISAAREAGANSWGTQTASSRGSNKDRDRGGGRGGDRGRSARNDTGHHPKQNERISWKDLGGDYLHFTLYKENKDTMEVVAFLARQLHVQPKSFQFAGTKDRRAVTVQRVSVHRVHADRMVPLGKTLRNASVGDYEYQTNGLWLGDLTGNEFIITLRDCHFQDVSSGDAEQTLNAASDIVESALKHLSERGFLNYYGLQRFGTFSTRTDTIGIKMLQGNFKAAVEGILHFSDAALSAAHDPHSGHEDVSTDDKSRASAINWFQTTGNSHRAIDMLPRKFSAESNIIRHLGTRGKERDYVGALQMVPRNLRLMYVHAYQSLIWNMAASHRWKEYGDRVVEGDLVLADEHKDNAANADTPDDIDADGEIIVQPAANDSAANPDDHFIRARALTAEEAASGAYTIYDVVLPTPGWDILYPSNLMRTFYETTMATSEHGGLDPHNMRRGWKDISLSGSYRKLLAKPGRDISFQVRTYTSDNEQFVDTDLDRMRKSGLLIDGKHGRERPSPEKGEQPEQSEGKRSIAEHENSEAIEAKSKITVQEPKAVETGTDGNEQALEAEQKIAVILKLQLGSSQYATMALRELMKLGGVKTYKPDFGGGR